MEHQLRYLLFQIFIDMDSHNDIKGNPVDEDDDTGEVEDVIEDEEAEGDDLSYNSSDYYYSTDSDDPYINDREYRHPYFYQYDSCYCKLCLAFKKLGKMYVVEDDSEDQTKNITKVDIYHYAKLLFKATEELDLSDSLKFLPKLFQKIMDKMKYKLQGDLAGLLYFPGKGYLPQTVVLQIVEILLESSFNAGTGARMYLIQFEVNSVPMKKCLLNIYHNFEELDNEIFYERSNRIFIQRYNFRNCNVTLECCRELPGPILLLINEVKALHPELSQALYQYEGFLEEIDVPYLRDYIDRMQDASDVEKLKEQFGSMENITSFVYVLWKKIDCMVEALSSHVRIEDIVAMCKIYKLSS